MTLHHISHHEGISQRELSNYSGPDKSSLSSQLMILEKNNYIIRKANKSDSRIKRIYLSKKAKIPEKSLGNIFQSWSQILLNGFSDEEQIIAREMLERMLENAKAEKVRIKVYDY